MCSSFLPDVFIFHELSWKIELIINGLRSFAEQMAVIKYIREIVMIKKFVVLIILLCLSGSMVFADDKYTMEDLDYLYKQGNFMEILEHMNDIRPSQRSQEWTTIVHNSVIKALENQIKTQDDYTAHLFAEQMLDKIGSLKQNKEFMKLRHQVLLKGCVYCFKNYYGGAECLQQLKKIVQNDPENKTLAFEAGKIVRKHMNASEAVFFFLQAMKGQSNIEHCNDPDVLLAMKSGMALPEDRAENTLELCETVCFEKLKPQLQEDFYQARGYAGKNYCKLFKKKGMLTEFQKAYCSDINGD